MVAGHIELLQLADLHSPCHGRNSHTAHYLPVAVNNPILGVLNACIVFGQMVELWVNISCSGNIKADGLKAGLNQIVNRGIVTWFYGANAHNEYPTGAYRCVLERGERGQHPTMGSGGRAPSHGCVAETSSAAFTDAGKYGICDGNRSKP